MEENRPPATPSASSPDHDRGRFFQLSLDLLCVAGIDGYFKQVNPSWTRVLGWSEAELLARPVVDFIHPDDRERTLQARHQLAESGRMSGLENRYLCKDGSHRWLAWQSAVEPGGTTVFAVARDITERRRLDQEHLILSKLESTGILAGGIAHDFNNLLTGLMLSIELLGMSGDLNPQQQQHLRQALKSTRSAQALTAQLITFAKGGTSARKTCDLRLLLQQSLWVALSGSNVRSDCRIPPTLWPAEINEDQIAQVIRNLVLNAREAMPSGGTVILLAENVELPPGLLSTLAPGRYVRLSVSDDGPGIAADVLPKIFDPYFSTKQRGPQKGMGLGLTICHSVIQDHGGAIAVDAPAERGTTVRVYLPATVAERSDAPAAALQSLPANILVMDDEEQLCEIIGQTLTQLGYTVETARHGDEALVRFDEARSRSHPFDLVLLDLTVKGGMGGADTLVALRQRDPAIKAVLMSGYHQESVFHAHADHGFQAALAKPFPMEKLRSLLARLLVPPAASTG